MTNDQIARLYDEYSLKKVFDVVAFGRALLVANKAESEKLERLAFEDHWISDVPEMYRASALNEIRGNRDCGGGYERDEIRWSWEAWQARAMLAASTAASAQSPRDACQIDNFSGRVCQHGTQSCVADHAEPAQSAEPVTLGWPWLAELHADAAYLFHRVQQGTLSPDDAAKSIREKIDAAQASLTAPQPSPTAVALDGERAAFEADYAKVWNAAMKENGWNGDHTADDVKDLREGDTYGEGRDYLNARWEGWQARSAPQPVEQTRALTDQMLEKLFWTAMDNAADILPYMEEARQLLSAPGGA
jgi:hypothetical protein